MSTDAHADADADAEAAQDWKSWHEHRTATVSAPYGPLSLTGTHWLSDYPEGRIPAVPGQWREDGDEVVLTAAAEDALTVDGQPLTGGVPLTADHGAIPDARVAHGERHLVVLRREGLWAVRDFDPNSPARKAFHDIEATAYDARWSLPGCFRPYEEHRSVRVENADGRERGLGLGGEIAFEIDGEERTLQVAVEPDGSLWAVFADATSGNGSYRFRFLRPSAPAADGAVTVDFNRSLLPPCAFADHFICPFPPPATSWRPVSRRANGTSWAAEPSYRPDKYGTAPMATEPPGQRVVGARSGRKAPLRGKLTPRILPNSACQEHGLSGNRTWLIERASWLRLTGPEPHNGPPIPPWRNDK